MSFNFNIISLGDIAKAYSDIELSHVQGDASIVTHASRISIHANAVSKYDVELLKFCIRILSFDINNGDKNMLLIVQCIILAISRNIKKINKITQTLYTTTPKFYVINFPIKWNRNRFLRGMDRKFYKGLENYASLDTFNVLNFLEMLNYINNESYSPAIILLLNILGDTVEPSLISRLSKYFFKSILFEKWSTQWRKKHEKK